MHSTVREIPMGNEPTMIKSVEFTYYSSVQHFLSLSNFYVPPTLPSKQTNKLRNMQLLVRILIKTKIYISLIVRITCKHYYFLRRRNYSIIKLFRIQGNHRFGYYYFSFVKLLVSTIVHYRKELLFLLCHQSILLFVSSLHWILEILQLFPYALYKVTKRIALILTLKE